MKISPSSHLLLIGISIALLQPISAISNPGIAIQGTYVLEKNQYPLKLKRENPSHIYIIYNGPSIKTNWNNRFFRKDTIINLKGLIDSSYAKISYRLIFETRLAVDSIWQTDSEFRITDKAFATDNGLLNVYAFDIGLKVTDRFVYNYAQKFKEENKPVPSLKEFLRIPVIYNRADRNKYAVASAWVLSIGIDRYDGNEMYRLRTCVSDAVACNSFFKGQFLSYTGLPSGYHEYVLTGKKATRTAILNTLKEIANGASPNDYFVFNFNGMSTMLSFDSVNYSTYFIPYDSSGYENGFFKDPGKIKEQINNRLISLKILQEHIQLISARNQLFISEAGPSEKFKTEFIKTMMQNSPEIASLLNINRVIMVPNKYGVDGFSCKSTRVNMAPINYSLTSLDTSYNIYDLFADDGKSFQIASALKSKIYQCNFSNEEYFDVFFERKFLQQYREIFGDAEKLRGGIGKNKEAQKNAGLKGARHALIIGTDNYKAKGWDKLNNPVFDASEIADILKEDYKYEVLLLKDPPMDSIYEAMRRYYKEMKPEDQLIIYVAGHGDYDKDLLDDGFIVCSDSKSVEDDPLRNSYIQHTKLKKMINKIPAKQILVMLDICYGGFFDEEVRDNPTSSITNRNVLELLHNNAQYKVRKMLSSVGTEPAFDGKAGKHSPFASYLISVLNAKGGNEGIITLADIYALLQKASLNETATLKISPHVAGFGDNNPLGEFILVPIENNK